MIKTNLMYGADVFDNGSVLPDASFFEETSLKSLRIRRPYSQNQLLSSSTWGNAVVPSGMLVGLNVSNPLSNSLSSLDISYGNLEVVRERSFPNSNGVWENDSIGVDFGAGTPQFVNAIRILLGGPASFYTGSTNSKFEGYEVFHSGNNSSWTSLGTFSSVKSITKGEMLFTFPRTQARYFKVHTGSAPDYKVNAFNNAGLVPQKIYFLDTTLGYVFKIKIDLGKNYKSDRVFINSFFHRQERGSVTVESSADDNTYVLRALTMGDLRTPLSSAPTQGKIYWDGKEDSIFLAGNDSLHKYNIIEDSWELVKSDSRFLGASPFSGYDSKNRVLYVLDSNTLSFKSYHLENDAFIDLPKAPFSLNEKSSSTFAQNSFYYIAPPNFVTEAIDALNLQTSLVQYNVITGRWYIHAVRNFTGASLARSLLSLEGVTDSVELLKGYFGSNDDFVLVPGVSSNILVTSINLDTGFSTNRGTGNTFNGLDYFYWNESESSSNLLAVDIDKGFLLSYLSSSGVQPFRLRSVDAILDLNLSNFYGPPSFDSSSAEKNIFKLDGPPLGTAGNVIYSPATQRYYKIGTSDAGGSSTDFVTLDSDYLVTLKASLIEDVRYIKIENNTSTVWPMVWESITVIEEDDSIRYGEGPFVLREDVSFTLDSPGPSKSVTVFNNHENITTSGISFIEPDGSEGSRYYQIGTSSSGTFSGHCIYNDLNGFVCTANNDNYNTDSCGILCSSGTGGPGALDGYLRDFIEIGAISSSGTGGFFVRSFLPSGTLGNDRKFFVHTELYE
jgi:hypothetical protein